MAKPKNILVLSYWSLREPLTAAAVFPYLRLLAARSDVGSIRLVTMESTNAFLPKVELQVDKVSHTPIHSRLTRFYMLSKVELFFRAVFILVRMVRQQHIDMVIAKASLAGAIVHLASRLTRVPYMVESFEPHSVYMLECGVWGRNSIRYRFMQYLEKLQLKYAKYIVTVTFNHRNDLIEQGFDPERLKVVPSITDMETFYFDPAARASIRSSLGIPENATVGIYVGKFGGLYFDTESFSIFSRAAEFFPDIHIIVLSPSDHNDIRSKARNAAIPDDRLHILVAMHVDVPRYLSAADFAFSLIKPSPIKRYQCPIKNGEYWACGLPILMTDGIADDHRLMRRAIGGAVFQHDLSDLEEAFGVIARMMMDQDVKERMRAVAQEYRSIRIAKDHYDNVL